MKTAAAAFLGTWLLAWGAAAGEAVVVEARAVSEGRGSWRFDVTIRHADEGWDHYANRWDVLGPDDAVLGSRTLFHPHVEEQPFTRSLPGVAVPEGVTEVKIRAFDSVHGQASADFPVQLSR